MCDHANREAAMIVIREGTPDESGRRRGGVWCDPCLVPLVAALIDAGIETVASCCGHGRRPGTIALRDGRWLVIAKDRAENDRIDTLFPVPASEPQRIGT